MTNWLGTRHDYFESLWVAILMGILVIIYAGLAYGSDWHTWNAFEIIGTWMITVSIWLVRTQNVQNWYWGILGTILIGAFMYEINLTGQVILNWVYFVPVSVWGLYNWAIHGKPTEFPPTHLSLFESAIVVGVIGVGTAAFTPIIQLINPATVYPILDAIVVVSSIVAQYLLGWKKVESWWLWLGPVNVLSVILFGLTGAYVLAGLYVVYFIHAAWAIYSWRTTANG